MTVDSYEFWFTPVGYNKPKELHIIKHKTLNNEEMSNIVFLNDEVEEEFNKLINEKDDIRIKILLYKWLFAKEYGLIENIPEAKTATGIARGVCDELDIPYTDSDDNEITINGKTVTKEDTQIFLIK